MELRQRPIVPQKTEADHRTQITLLQEIVILAENQWWECGCGLRCLKHLGQVAQNLKTESPLKKNQINPFLWSNKDKSGLWKSRTKTTNPAIRGILFWDANVCGNPWRCVGANRKCIKDCKITRWLCYVILFLLFSLLLSPTICVSLYFKGIFQIVWRGIVQKGYEQSSSYSLQML